MTKLKKIATLLLALIMIFTFVSCSGGEDSESESDTSAQSVSPVSKEDVNIAVLMGPTGIGLTKLMEYNENGSARCNYNFTVCSSPDEIVGKISTGEIDVAAAPINLAATLSNKTNGNIQLMAINTLGVLYILDNGADINSIEDLRGKTIYATGQGSTPEYILNFILEANGLDGEVQVEYLSEHAELASRMAAGDVEVAMLPEPNVTSVLMQNENVRIALDLTEEWNKACSLKGIDNGTLIQGCLIVRKDWDGYSDDTLSDILDDCKSSVDFVNSNIPEAAVLTEEYGIMGNSAAAEKAIPNCNITFITGEDMKTAAEQNLNILFEANPKSVGGTLPDESFYYIAK